MTTWRPSMTPSDVIMHSAKGSEWEEHKYIVVKDGKYYYPNSYDKGRTVSDLKESQLSDEDVDKIAEETRAGKHGNGEERKKKFGSDYDRIQNRVNEKEGAKKRHEEEESDKKDEEEKKEDSESKEEEKKDSEEKEEDKKSSKKGSSKKKSDEDKKKSSKGSSSKKSAEQKAAEKAKKEEQKKAKELKARRAKNQALIKKRTAEQQKEKERRMQRNRINRKAYLNHSQPFWGPSEDPDVICHFGILGMHWGKRNGPPYPLSSDQHSAEEKKAAKAAKKAARAERKAEHEAKKAARQEKKDLKKAKREFKKETKAEKKRQKVLKTGSLQDVRKLKGNISNEEYNEVFKRLENEKKLDEFDTKKKEEFSKKVQTAQNVVSNINTGTKAALELYNRGASVYNAVAKRKHWSVQDLPIIKENDDSKEKAEKAARDYFINKATPDQVNATRSSFTGEDLGKAMSRMKTNQSFDDFYEEWRKKNGR